VGQDQGTLVGLQRKLVDAGNSEGASVYVMPPLYSVDLLTVLPPQWALANSFDFVTRSLSVQYAPNGTLATVPHVPIAAGLAVAGQQFIFALRGQAGLSLANIEMPQPFASTVCVLNAIMGENDTRPIQFPDTYLAGCDTNCSLYYLPNNIGVANYTGITRKQLWDEAMNQTRGRMIWVDDIRLAPSMTGSSGGLGVIVVQPNLCDNGQVFLSTSACAVSGLWANVSSQLTAQTDGVSAAVTTHAQSLLSSTFLGDLPSPWPQHAIAPLSKDWANSITSQTSNQNRTVADNLLRTLLLTDNICPPNGIYSNNLTADDRNTARPYTHEALISSLIANGLSHVAGPFEQWQWGKWDNSHFQWRHIDEWSGEERTSSQPPGIVLTFHGHLMGYAWSLDGTGIKIAVPILIIYCLYTTVYVLYTFITGRSSQAWDTISGLVALAMNSRPTEVLENTSAGISQTDTFRNLVSVREVVDRNERLELVFQRDEHKYRGGGGGGEGEGVALRRVQVGRAY
jgi:hypothetical protein